ncbi:hypothetical protein HPB47_025012 [Ixodes persulcatus]|uniref:Uncharacterized protein n=1 Tax=Ixodes persulcatus TaxID=34615 RepID=A0AC60Q2P5_IXOPE|nr:hypothetical protein HPB47_025012 [Ixodes persulcatus]
MGNERFEELFYPIGRRGQPLLPGRGRVWEGRCMERKRRLHNACCSYVRRFYRAPIAGSRTEQTEQLPKQPSGGASSESGRVVPRYDDSFETVARCRERPLHADFLVLLVRQVLGSKSRLFDTDSVDPELKRRLVDRSRQLGLCPYEDTPRRPANPLAETSEASDTLLVRFASTHDSGFSSPVSSLDKSFRFVQ